MGNRLYKKGEPFRDARLFVIACEGEKREKEYFEFFNTLSQRVKVKVLEHEVSGKSAPKWVLDRAAKYTEEFGLTNDDQLWLVMDTDKWKRENFDEIQLQCSNMKQWYLAISNPCFEVWLFMHLADIKTSKSLTCKNLKTELDTSIIGGYEVKKFIQKIQTAIKNAKEVDKTQQHYMPDLMTTKVYKLAQQIASFIKF